MKTRKQGQTTFFVRIVLALVPVRTIAADSVCYGTVATAGWRTKVALPVEGPNGEAFRLWGGRLEVGGRIRPHRTHQKPCEPLDRFGKNVVRP